MPCGRIYMSLHFGPTLNRLVEVPIGLCVYTAMKDGIIVEPLVRMRRGWSNIRAWASQFFCPTSVNVFEGLSLYPNCTASSDTSSRDEHVQAQISTPPMRNPYTEPGFLAGARYPSWLESRKHTTSRVPTRSCTHPFDGFPNYDWW